MINELYNRKIVLDTETTGMNKTGKLYENHGIIEIGAVEIINRQLTGNNFHVYIQPNRLINPEAFKIHGISDSFLSNKPVFSEIVESFIKYIKHSEMIIHNAEFDIGFLNYEIQKLHLNIKKISELCKITDTLKIARSSFPGKKNNLDALCKRYNINVDRKLHSAIIDANVLAKIYLRMTSVQKTIFFQKKQQKNYLHNSNLLQESYCINEKSLTVLKVNTAERIQHETYLNNMEQSNCCLWKKLYNSV